MIYQEFPERRAPAQAGQDSATANRRFRPGQCRIIENKYGTMAKAVLYVDNKGIRRDRYVRAVVERIGSRLNVGFGGNGCAERVALALAHRTIQ